MLTNNKNVLSWVDDMVALCKPDKVVWIDGSEEQLNALRDEAVATGEMERLNEEKLPGCLLHRTLQNDVARVEARTFICSRKEEDAGPTNNWCDPKEMYAKLTHDWDSFCFYSTYQVFIIINVIFRKDNLTLFTFS